MCLCLNILRRHYSALMGVCVCVCVCLCVLSPFSRVQLFATLWTVILHAPQSMGLLRQEYWSGLPCPPPGDLPYPGIEPGSPASQADSLPSEPPGKPRNTGESSLPLLQGIVPVQKLKWGLLHFRQILNQLSYQDFMCLYMHF